MRVLLLFILFFSFSNVVLANEVHISKVDADTDIYVRDSSFTIYDDKNMVIDSWLSTDDIHVVSLEIGEYKLVETPILNNEPAYSLSNYYDISVDNDEVMELKLYNNKIETPRNLSMGSSYVYIGIIFFMVGLLIVVLGNFIKVKHIII
ncbi:MAG: hypothetical protein J6D28_01830 [Bacilli bacterium]|nr:hypothetical protein [Bacilli bacterium]